ncbi:SpoIIE family protein phosphatase [Streptomyces sp. NPDC006527]|uniref:ATP-binding SpoIIE family protein phosphatase n=1 Tax=Streptomyces sp. NPDC006527 TaxID=3364749 RepID=UPI0036C749D5
MAIPNRAGERFRNRSPEDVLAAELQKLHCELDSSTLAVYLVQAEGSLEAAVIVDTPLSFAITPVMAAGDTRFISVQAHQSGLPVTMDREQAWRLVSENPAFVQHAASPMEAIAVPIRSGTHRFGTISARWMSDRRVPAGALERMVRAATDLARLMEHKPIRARAVPLFVPESNSLTANASGYLLRLQRLGTALTAAHGVHDLVAATYTELVLPFGGTGVLLCTRENGRLRVVGAAGISAQEIRGLNDSVIREGTPEGDVVMDSMPRTLGPEELAAAYPGIGRYEDQRFRSFLPMVCGDRTVGCCVLVLEREEKLREDEQALLMVMLGQISQTLERIRSHQMQDAVTQSMQRLLLPRDIPDVPGLESTARYLPAAVGADVGGDWYDVIVLPGGQIGMIIGDVEGHNLEAVGTMGQMRSAVRAYAAEGHDPASVLTRSNHLLDELGADLFVTCCCLWLDTETGVAKVASAGHPEPMVANTQGEVVDITIPVGPPLGVAPETIYGSTEMVVPPGAVIALFTDGLLDARERGMPEALDRLRQEITDHASENLEALADRITEAASGEGRHDDIALLLLRQGGASSSHRRTVRTTVPRHATRRVHAVRHFARDLMSAWGHTALTDDIEILISEVVTNALIHAHTEVEIRLSDFPDRVRVEVRDNDPHPPIPVVVLDPNGVGDDEAESGRGLLIVDAIASAWGSTPAGRGKTTWFELRPPDTSAP